MASKMEGLVAAAKRNAHSASQNAVQTGQQSIQKIDPELRKQVQRNYMLNNPQRIQNAVQRIENPYLAVYNTLNSGAHQTVQQMNAADAGMKALMRNTQALQKMQSLLGDQTPVGLMDAIGQAQTGYAAMLGDWKDLRNSWRPETYEQRQLRLRQEAEERRQAQFEQYQQDERERLRSIDYDDTQTEIERLQGVRNTAQAILTVGSASGLTYGGLLSGGLQSPMEQMQDYLESEGFSNVADIDAKISELMKDAQAARGLNMTADAQEADDFAYYSAQGMQPETETHEERVSRLTEALRAANNNPNPVGARAVIKANGYDSKEDLERALQAEYMTEDEAAVYAYYRAKYGDGKAAEYVDAIADELNLRAAQEEAQGFAGTGAKNRIRQIGAGVSQGFEQFKSGMEGFGRQLTGSAEAQPTSKAAYLGMLAREELGSLRLRDDENITNDNGFSVSRQRQGTSIGQVAFDLTSTTANMLPSILASTAANAILPGSGEIVGAGLIGASAGGNAYDEMIRLGYAPAQASAYAKLTGASEAGLQYLLGGVTQLGGKLTGSITNKILMNVDNALAITAIKLGQEFVSEGTEEYLQDVLEPIFRNIAFGENNEVRLFSKEALYSGVLGGVSALLMSGGGTVSETLAERRIGLDLVRHDINAQRIAEIGRTFPVDSDVARLASRISNDSGAFAIGRLFNEIGASLSEQNISDIESGLIAKGVTERDASEIAREFALAVESPDALTENQQRVLEKTSVATDTIREVLLNDNLQRRNEGVRSIQADLRTRVEDIVRENMEAATVEERVDEPTLERQQQRVREVMAETDDRTFIDGFNQLRQEITQEHRQNLINGSAAEANATERVMNVLDDAFAAAEEISDTNTKAATIRAAINESLGGINNGTAGSTVSYDGSGRIAGERAGVEAGAVRSDAYRGDGTVEGSGQANDVVADGEVWRSSAELNIPDGTDNKNIREKMDLTDGEEEKQNIARALGYNLRYVNGAIEVRNRRSGSVQHMTGVAYGGEIVVQADSGLYTSEQLAEHEITHARVAQDPALLMDVMRQLVQEHDYMELDAIIRRYAAMYNYIYGDESPSMTSDERDALYMKYFEEVVADAAAGISRVSIPGRGAASYTDTVQRIMRERVSSGNAGAEVNEARYSIARTTDNRPFVVVDEDILEGVPRLEWRKTVRDVLQERFANGVQVPNDIIKINRTARKEFTNSKDTKILERSDIQAFLDKMRLAYNADDVIRAAQNWVGEAPVHDNTRIREFARGEVLVRVGGRDYSADVLVGTMNDGSLMLYDVVGLTPTEIKEKTGRGAVSPESRADYSLATDQTEVYASTSNISDTAAEVNTKNSEAEEEIPGLRLPTVEEPRYSYGGEHAGTANIGNLENAESMERTGQDSETIRRETGWFRGMDGKWRFEISDADMVLHMKGDAQFRTDHPAYARYQTLMEQMLYGDLTSAEETELRQMDEIWGREFSRLSDIVENGRATLGMILDHPALFAAYPQLRDVRVRFMEMDSGERGSYDPRTGTIDISNEMKGSPAKVLDTLAHEVQHCVQSIEGFTGGASTDYWSGEKSERVADAEFHVGELEERLKKQQDFVRMLERNGWDEGSSLYQTALEDLQDLQGKYNNATQALNDLKGSTNFELYDRTAGEIEARDVTARRNMSENERRNTRPDIDRDNAVLAETAGSLESTVDPFADVEPQARFSMSDEIEETRNLVAVHNVTEEKLRGVLELGGLPMPSIAIVKAADGHAKYGAITFLFDKSTIDPEADPRNRVYGSDAWTPTGIQVDYRVDYDTMLAAERKIEELSRQTANGMFSSSSVIRQFGIEDETNMTQAEIAERMAERPEVQAAYAAEHGIPVEIKYRAKEFDALWEKRLTPYAEEIGIQALEDQAKRIAEGEHLTAEEIETAREFVGRSDSVDERKQRIIRRQAERASDIRIEDFVMHAWQKHEDNGQPSDEPDRFATSDAMRESLDMRDVRAWASGLIDGILGEPGIYNGKEVYTYSGNRRSFDQLHMAYTLENIVKAMGDQQSARGQNAGMTASGLQSVSSPEYRSVQEIRADRDRLGPVETEEYGRITDEINSEIKTLVNDIARSNGEENSYTAKEIIEDLMIRGAETGRSTPELTRLFARESEYRLEPELARRLAELYDKAAVLPTEYFEAKPQRAVGFDEVKAAIIPDDTSQDIRAGLERYGVPIREYERGNEEDRLRVLNEYENLRFSTEDTNPDAWEAGEIEAAEREEILTQKAVEAMTTTELRQALQEDRADAKTYERILKDANMPEEVKTELRKKLREVNARIEREVPVLREINQRERAARKEQQRIAEAKQAPTKTRADFINGAMEIFQTGVDRSEVAAMLGRAFDDARSRGYMTQDQKSQIVDRLIESGVATAAADPYYADIRSNIAGTRIYVPQDVRTNWTREGYEDIRHEAFRQGIILTSNSSDLRIDSLNAEMAEMYPGAFDAGATDMSAMLENIIDMARQGRSEQISLAEMLQRNQDNEGWRVDDQIDDLANRLDQLIDRTMYAAGIEVEQKARTERTLTKEREQRREAIRRQAEARQLREDQQRTLKSLQWLQRNDRKIPAEIKAQIGSEYGINFDEVLSSIDLYAASIANEMRWSEKHQATWRDLADMYAEAKRNDPNFLPSKELEQIWARVNLKKVSELDVDALSDLYKAASALRTEYYNRNNVIGDEEHRLFSEWYGDATADILASAGKGNLGEGLGKLMTAEMMTPMNLLNMMGGWKSRGQFYDAARQLQAGERAKKGYETEAKAMLDQFNKDHADWIRRADGQGKNAIWEEIEVPECLELRMGDKPIFGDTVKVYMTPMQKVQMYLESKNDQNLRHMLGGRTFVNKELYAQGKRTEALAQGTTVRLAPETVKGIVANMTAEEMELAGLLERYYNEYASGEINRVSQILYGYDKAMTQFYAPIFTDSNYNKTTAGIFDVTAEGVGHMKTREQVSKNPSYNISAIDAFERHVGQASRFVGLAIPIRNVERLMNWTGNGTSMKATISKKWGKEGVDYIQKLLTELQSPTTTEQTVIGKFGSKALSNYITAVFGANPGIMLKQFASFPAAAAVLDGPVPIARMFGKVDEKLIAKYTPELAYRKLGQSMPEIAAMRDNPSWLDRNRFTRFWFRGGGIQAVDTFTVKSLWAWAENTVRKANPELEVGTQEQIDAGTSEFYKAVAEKFNEAVNLTQPMYDTMNRANIMNSDNALTRTFTLFKTVPLQEYNTLRRAFGQAQTEGKTGKRQAARAIGTVLASTVMLEAFEAVNAFVKNGLRHYRDDDDELTAESFARQFGMNMAGDLAGIMIGGSEIFEALGSHFGWNDYSSDFQIVGAEQINEMRDAVTGAATLLETTVAGMIDVASNGGDVGEYLNRNAGDIRGGIKNIATALAKYMGGLPVENIEKYLTGILGQTMPEAAAVYEGWFDTTTKKDLGYIDADELPTRLGDIMTIRGIDIDEGTAEELARLYTAGEHGVVPVDTPTSIRVNGDDVALSPYQRQVYDNSYSSAIGESLDALISSAAYQTADDETRARMLEKLYKYAQENAALAVNSSFDADGWIEQAQAAQRDGLSLDAYIALTSQGLTKTADKMEYLAGMGVSDDEAGKLYYYAIASDSRRDDVDALRDAGMDWATVYDTMSEYLDVDAMEDTSANMKAATFMTWAYENLDAEETAAALENLTFSSGFKASPDGYQRLVDSGLDPDDALALYGGWGALQPEGDSLQVTVDQKLRFVAESTDLTTQEKTAAIGVLLGTNTTTESGGLSQYGKFQAMMQAGLSIDDYMTLREAGAVNRWQWMREDGLGAQTAMTAAIALQNLKPEPGEDSVSTLQKVNAIMDAVPGNDDQITAIKSVLYDTQAQKLDQAVGYGITARTYVDFLNTIQNYYSWDPSGSATSLSQKECTAALQSMNLTNTERAVLWQIQTMGKNGKNNPFSTSIGKEVYDTYQAWSEQEKEEAEAEKQQKIAEAQSNVIPGLNLPIVEQNSNVQGLALPTYERNGSRASASGAQQTKGIPGLQLPTIEESAEGGENSWLKLPSY